MTDSISRACAEWHEKRGTSPSLISLHLDAFRAGAKGRTVSANPLPGGVYAHEWEMARAAGAAFAQPAEPVLPAEREMRLL